MENNMEKLIRMGEEVNRKADTLAAAAVSAEEQRAKIAAYVLTGHKEEMEGLAKIGSWLIQFSKDTDDGLAKLGCWFIQHDKETMEKLNGISTIVTDNRDKLIKIGNDLQQVGQKVDDVHKDVKVVDGKVDKIAKKLNVRDMDGWDIFFGVASGLAFAALVAFLLRGLPESMAIIHDAYGQATGIDMERCRHIWIIIGLLGGFVGIFIGSCVAQWNCKRRG